MTTSIGVLRLPRSIQFGFGSREAILHAAHQLGERAFIVVDPFLAPSAEFQGILRQLDEAGVTTCVHTEVLPELPVTSLQASAEVAAAFAPDVIIGWGGGSALDAAKLVALLVAHGGTLADYYGENAVPGEVLPLIAVPTTAGTGSEVTPVAVVADTERELKVGISSPYLIPHTAIVDPELTLGAPPTVTAYSGIDALVHAIESYTAADLSTVFNESQPVFIGRNALSDPLSLEAVRLIGPHLERAVNTPSDRDARAAMAKGSLLAGLAFGNTGTHLSHAIQYPIGALTHTPHGLGTGLMLPYVMQAISSAVPERLARIGDALGTESTAEAAIERVAQIVHRIGVPASLADIGIKQGDLGRIAELALSSRRLAGISPVPADIDLLTHILTAAHAGDRASLRA
ncbi:iron-containing alcohol dehydrogenase [Microbacterium sp. NPDC089696]|uniref:iron-containing alcohol dehydrogenase n=1 Tax=Microbacterium sp. NPDC089696 TaxID=3364199 RepID=UPI00380B0F73